jgi:hypothetical protein
VDGSDPRLSPVDFSGFNGVEPLYSSTRVLLYVTKLQ